MQTPHHPEVGSLRAPLLAFALAASWILAQALDLALLGVLATAGALWAVAATAPAPSRRLHVALGVIMLPLLVGFLLLLGPFREGFTALLVEGAMVAILAPLAPLLYAWTFTRRHGSRRP